MEEDIIISLLVLSFVYAQNNFNDTNGKVFLFRGNFGVKIASVTKNVIYRYQK